MLQAPTVVVSSPTSPRKDHTVHTAQVIVVSDRVCGGERRDTAGAAAVDTLRRAGLDCPEALVVAEGAEPLRSRLVEAIDDGVQVVLTIGGTGIGVSNLTPEVSMELIDVRLTGLETQILVEGLKSTPRAGLSRGIVGVTARGGEGTLIANAPNSTGAVADCLGVLVPLLPSIFEKF